MPALTVRISQLAKLREVLMTKLVILTKQGQIGKKKLAVRTELTRSICGEGIKHGVLIREVPNGAMQYS